MPAHFVAHPMKIPRCLLVAPLLLALVLPASAAESKDDHPPIPLKRVPPHYTDAMKKNRPKGDVIVDCIVDEKGAVTKAAVQASLTPEADQAALECVQQWTFEPATKDGLPVATHLRIPIRFSASSPGGASKLDTPPRPLKQVPPVSTDAMRRSSLRGTVTIECIVDEKGRVTDARVGQSLSPEADQAALACAQKWLFQPATKDGQPVKARMSLPFQFSFN
jgi:protein TonB